jgi:radical SAM protein with 4Fe4S-binding SPASM domain
LGEVAGQALSGIGIEIMNSACQCECPQCYARKTGKEQEHLNALSKEIAEIREKTPPMPLERVKRIVEHGIRAGVKEYYLVGAGEPTLHPQMVEIASFIMQSLRMNFGESGGLCVIATNGLRLSDEKYCRQLAETGATIMPHYDVFGTDGEAVRALSEAMGLPLPVAEDYAKKMQKGRENLLRMSEELNGNLGKVFFQHCLSGPTVRSGQTERVFSHCVELGVGTFFEMVRTSPNFQRGHKNDLSLEEVREAYETLAKIAGSAKPQVSPALDRTCHMVRTGVHILANGDVVPCCGTYAKLGNIFKQDLRQILDSPLRKHFEEYASHIQGICRKCEYFEYCGGGCRGNAYQSTGCFDASNPHCPQLAGKEVGYEDIIGKECGICDLKGFPNCAPKERIPFYKNTGLVFLQKPKQDAAPKMRTVVRR